MDYTVKQDDTLSQIALQNNTDTNTLASTNNISDINKIFTGQTIKLPVSPTNTVSVNNFENKPAPFQVPTTQTQSIPKFDSTYNATIQGANDYIASLMPSEPSPYETEYKGIMSQLLGQTNTQSTMGEYQQNLENQQNVTGKRQLVQDLTNQINAIDTQATQNQQNIGKFGDTTQGSANVEEIRFQKEANIKKLGISAQLAAAQGNLALAEDNINRAVDLKTKDTQNKVDILRLALEQNRFELERSDTKAYNEQKLRADYMEKRLNNERADMETIQKIAISAGGYGANAAMLSKIANSKTVAEAIENATGFLSDPMAQQQARAELMKLNEDIKATYGVDGLGVVGGYDISSYATDPNHEVAVSSIYESAKGQPLSSLLTQFKGTKITEAMINKAAEQSGVDPYMIYAMMAQDSSMGTKGTGARNNNPGNIGQFDHLTGAVKGYGTLQEGVNAVASWLSRKKVSKADSGVSISSTAQTYVDAINKGKATLDETVKGLGTSKEANKLKAEIYAGVSTGTLSPELQQEKQAQMTTLMNNVNQAMALANASGPSGLSKAAGDFFIGDTKFRQLEAITNTLKTNMLTLATDPSIKKFFGPQMSNADVELMTSAATTLNPEKQSPAQIKAELERLQGIFNKLGGVGVTQTPNDMTGRYGNPTGGVTSSGVSYTVSQ